MDYQYEMILCIVNAGFSDAVMDTARKLGAGGGTVVATGTPEEVAMVPQSYTGQFLKKKL